MFYYLFVTLYVVACVVLMIVILLQQGKGGDIANAFGGGSSQAVFGARTGATLLTKVTAGFAVAFGGLALLLAIWGSRGTGSVVGGVDGPPPVSLPAGATDIPTQPITSTPPPAATPEPEAAPATPPAAPATLPAPAKKQ